MYQMSMNFDLENVKPFLHTIKSIFDSGFGDSEVEKVSSFTESIDIDNEDEIIFDVIYQGKEERLVYRVFMDDHEAPDIYFFSTSENITKKIGDLFIHMCEKLGI